MDVKRDKANGDKRWAGRGSLLCMVILVALAVRIGLSFIVPMTTGSDAGAYYTMATNLSEGQGVVDGCGNLAYYSAGYPIMLGSVFAVTGNSLPVILLVNLVLAIVSVWLLWRMGCAIGDSRLGLLAALLWSLYLPSVLLANRINKENLMIPLMLAIVLLALRWSNSSRRLLWAATAGALTGILAVVGPTGCVVAVVFVVVVALQASDWRQRVISGMLFASLFIAALGPWLIRNQIVLGAPVLNTNGGFNLYLGNNPAATGEFVSIGETPMKVDWNRIKDTEGEVAASDEARRRAKEYMKEHPGRTLGLMLNKAGLFWIPPIHRGDEPDSTTKAVARLIWLIQYCALLVLAFGGLRDIRRTWPLYLAIALFMGIHLPFYVMSRYRLPIMAVICVLAAGTLLSGWERWAKLASRQIG